MNLTKFVLFSLSLIALAPSLSLGAKSLPPYPNCIPLMATDFEIPFRESILTLLLKDVPGDHPLNPLAVGRQEIINELMADPEFPEADRADVVAILKLTPELYAQGYDFGVFGWRELSESRVTIHSPEQRGVLFFDEMKIPDTFQKWLRANVEKNNNAFYLTADKAFEQVVDGIATMDRQGRPAQSKEWFKTAIRDAYVRMHHKGYAHSIEVWERSSGQLVAGIIGTAAKGYFAGETMFHKKVLDDSGKVIQEWGDVGKMAGLGMILILRENGYKWLDTQTIKPGTVQSQFRARYVPRDIFHQMIKEAQDEQPVFKVPANPFSIYFAPYTKEEAEAINQPGNEGRANKNKLILIKADSN